MVTIDNLMVTVKVEGDADADEIAFAKLFNKYIELWQRESAAAKVQEQRSRRDRSLGDGGGYSGEGMT